MTPKTEDYPHADSRAARMLTEGLAALSQERGMSLRRAAKELGLRQSTVLSHMANGRMPIPIDRAQDLAEITGLPVREFILAVLEQRHPTTHWKLVVAGDSVASDLEAYAGQPLEALPPEQLRVLREAAADPNAARRWLTVFETPVMELIRELRSDIAVNGMGGADRDRLALALASTGGVPSGRVNGPTPRPVREKS